jgi:hypothetical protein
MKKLWFFEDKLSWEKSHQILDLNVISIIWALDDFKWKNLNYKVMNLNGIYNFCITFIVIRVQMKELWFFKICYQGKEKLNKFELM